MADVKISGLPASTLPLAGTEVLPLVQGGVTKKVASDDLTVKNVRSNATTGILQVVGPAAATTRVMTTPDANFAAARTDAAQSFTGDQTLSTGNLVIGTSGKGIDFSATPGTGTSELFNDYETGTFTPTWTPASGSGQNVNIAYGYYTKIGNRVSITINIGTNGHGTASGTVTIGGLPFNPAATAFEKGGFYCVNANATGLGVGRVPAGVMNYAAASFTPVAWGAAGGNFAAMSAVDWGVSGEYFFVGSYQTT